MKRIHIFKTGTHTSAAGQTLSFSEADLQASVDNYDPALHEAPIVIGHPKDNGPAFGWVNSLSFHEGNLDAIPQQVNEDFAEMVAKGSFKKVSASWYAPDAPSNPKPGAFYLRHVGFLGAMPPAIKGLQGVEFSEEEEGVVEFAAEWESAGIFRRLREFLIEKFGVEEADKAIPDYMVQGAEDAARMPASTETPDYSESTDHEDSTMTEQELKDAQAKLEADQAALEAQRTEFTEQQEAAAEAAKAARIASIHSRVDALVEAGKIVPAQAPGIKQFAEQLDANAAVEFGEGDDATKESALDFYLNGFEAAKAGPEFGEAAPGTDDGTDTSLTAEQLAVKANEYREERAKAGTTISYSEAVQTVMNQ